MPRGPKGEKRPADAIGATVGMGKLTTGEEEEECTEDDTNNAASELGQAGGIPRAKRLDAEKLRRGNASCCSG